MLHRPHASTHELEFSYRAPPSFRPVAYAAVLYLPKCVASFALIPVISFFRPALSSAIRVCVTGQGNANKNLDFIVVGIEIVFNRIDDKTQKLVCLAQKQDAR